MATLIELLSLNTNKVVTNIVTDPHPTTETTDCGCETGQSDTAMLIEATDISSYKTYVGARNYGGVFFSVEDDEVCTLNVKFDYIFKFDCDDLINGVAPQNGIGTTISSILENLEVRWSLEDVTSPFTPIKLVDEPLFNIGQGGLVDHIKNNENSGFIISGSNCNAVNQRLINEFGDDCDIINDNTLNSSWLTLDYTVTNSMILSAITNNKVMIAIYVVNTEIDNGIYLDRIQLNKDCVETQITNSTITSSPGFELLKTIDNKKSWVVSDSADTRNYDLELRETNYNINHHKLGLNSKQLDLNFDYAKPLECDVFAYYQDCPFEDIVFSADCGSTDTCPSGYTLSPAGDACVRTLTATTAITGATYPVVAGGNVSSYGGSGARFYGNLTGLEYPLQDSGLAGGSIQLVDATNDPTPYPADFVNPNGNLVPILTNISRNSVVNSIWGGGVGHTSSTGRLNAVGVWTSSGTTSGEFIGFSHCFEIPVGGTYWVGIAADNYCRFTLNGELVFFFELGGGFKFDSFGRWHMFQLPLQSGKNIIEMEGANDGGLVAFGAEIYSADTATLTGATTEAELGIVFSTKDLIGGVFDIGDSSGYSPCPDGYALDLCGASPVCTIIDREDVIIGQGIITGTTNPADLLSIDHTDSSLTYEELFRVYSTELIDVKTSKTLQSYPLLRKIFDDYSDTDLRCINTTPLNYEDTIKFGALVDNFWVDLVEQVMPSTAMWSSTYVYRSSLFDFSKFKYPKYSLLNPEDNYPLESIGTSTGVELMEFDITDLENNPECAQVAINSGATSNVTIIQMDCGSEFYGSYTIIENNGENAFVAP